MWCIDKHKLTLHTLHYNSKLSELNKILLHFLNIKEQVNNDEGTLFLFLKHCLNGV